MSDVRAENLQSLIDTYGEPDSFAWNDPRDDVVTWTRLALVQEWADGGSWWIAFGDTLDDLWSYQSMDDWTPVCVADLDTGERWEIKVEYSLGSKL